MRRLPGLVAVVALLAVPAAAGAQDRVLAQAPNAAGITAYGGHVVVSRRDPETGRWSLVRWHAGIADVLPVASRRVPFDADAGPGPDGRPVLVYSRCAREPNASGGLAPSDDWTLASGCDLFELPLTGPARERRLRVPGDDRNSETTPSMWRGALAFARRTPGARVPTVEYRARGASRLRTLGGGSVQLCRPTFRCGFDDFHDGVEQLDLGTSRVAFLWRMTGGFVYGTGVTWELRAAALVGGRSTLLDTGYISGACGFRLPSGATADRSPISYLAAGSTCEVTRTQLTTIDPVTGTPFEMEPEHGVAVGMVRDGSTIYWLRSSGTTDVPAPGARSCTAPEARCELVATTPRYTPGKLRRVFPQGDVDQTRGGHRWVRGPGGVDLLRPPARVPCALSRLTTYVRTSARWSRGRHTVRVVRRERGRKPRPGGQPQTRNLSPGYAWGSIGLRRCGDRVRITYVVTTGRRTKRRTFTVRRAPLPR